MQYNMKCMKAVLQQIMDATKINAVGSFTHITGKDLIISLSTKFDKSEIIASVVRCEREEFLAIRKSSPTDVERLQIEDITLRGYSWLSLEDNNLS